MTQPEALRLADELGVIDYHGDVVAYKAAAELRRLHASCEDYAQHKQRQDRRVLELKAQRDALLEALKDLMQQYKDQPECFMDWSKARAAIKTVEENT